MKSIKIFSVFLGSVLLLGGCESLDYIPADQMSSGTFWKTEAHAKQAAVGLYAAMKAQWCFGMEFTFDMCTDLADGTNPWSDVSRGTSFSSNSGGVQNHWQYLYELVHRSNTVIRNVANMDISQTTIDQVTGEAKFLRAMAYFRMLNGWGGVPYYDETCDINNEFATVINPRSSAEEIRQHILEDLNEAIAKLPVSWETNNYGRATKGAAYALRGKVYLFNKEWSKAIADFEEIVYNKSNNYGYALHPNYEDLFRIYNGKRSNEMIFSIQSIDNNTAGYALDIVSYFGNKSTMRLIAGNQIVPSTTLVDMYENLDGSKFNWDKIYPGFNSGDSQFRRNLLSVAIDQGSTTVINTLDCDTTKVLDVYRKRDPRLCWNVITPYSHYLGTDAGSNPRDKQFVLADPSKGGSPMEAFAFIRNSEGWNSYFWRKWIPTGNLGGYWGEYTRTPYEFPLIRLGDVLLMLAEAYNENGETDKAVIEVNKVRARVEMPGLNSGAAWLAVNGKEEMAQRIRDERAYELAGEGQRYWDIRRWGMLQSTVKNATDIFGDLMYERKYQSRHEIWPIPLVEMERNTNLTQNSGW
ncbi:MAG: RagB/SusD family nutrient uptake outer membrane protein [Massilibacteroides sp.]|nr:RagB/SusD family nutrient uptake outer membrane protein [Massilibacteroides sp.]MDD3061805.1 RagB/SusD family nutrient uptake outer membrane protein [Massilibacteroides sp.]MDD4660087.1 RagB/SusD family nutrient uptake outer membrane protein [Massilibacteroides sp.]